MPKPGVGIRGGDIDFERRRLGFGIERPSRQLRPKPVQRPAQWAERNRQPLPGGLDSSTSIPGPGFEGFEDRSVEASYYTWVDQHNTVGLGENVPISTGQSQRRLRRSEGRQDGPAAHPLPMGFYAKGLDGRIDDPKPAGKAGPVEHQGDDPWLMEGAKARSDAPSNSGRPIRGALTRRITLRASAAWARLSLLWA